MTNGVFMNKEISVVMTTYNGEKYIKEQLDSILSQTLLPKEIVVVDDCSTDGTWSILNDYAKKCSIVKITRNENNLGAHQNFRKAFSLSSCDIIAPSDQDDIWMKNKLEVLCDILVEKDVELVYSQDDILWEDGRIEYYRREMPSVLELIWSNSLRGHTFLFRRELLSVFDVAKILAFDYALPLLASLRDSYASSEQALTVWRRHEGVMNTVFSEKSELVVSNVSTRRKTKSAFVHLREGMSNPIQVNFSDKARIFSEFLDGPKGEILSRICDNVAKQTHWSMLCASLGNMRVQQYEGGLKNKLALAFWAFRQPWVYWYDTHKLKSL